MFGVNWAVVLFQGLAGKAGTIKFFGDFVVFAEGLAKMIQTGGHYQRIEL